MGWEEKVVFSFRMFDHTFLDLVQIVGNTKKSNAIFIVIGKILDELGFI